MALIRINTFRGETPRTASHLLPVGAASIALDCKLWGGKLAPYRGLLEVAGAFTKAGAIKSVYRYAPVAGVDGSGFFFHWNEEVDVVRAPIGGDTMERTVFTGADYPRVTDATIATGGSDYPTVSYRLGIPAPANAPTLVVNDGGGTYTPEEQSTRSYLVSYVSAWGEEGPPSAATTTVTIDPDDTVTINSLPAAPAGNYNIEKVRIYRTITGASGTTFQYVDQVAIGVTSYLDSSSDSSLPDVELVSQTWDPPPDDMHSIVQMAGGMTVGACGNQVCPSEPYLPHAYNPLNRQTTNHPVVALGSFNNTLVALTEKNPYVAVGSAPELLLLSEHNIGQGCVSGRSAISGRSGVMYASPDGLINIGEAGVSNRTEQLLNRDQWQAMKPSTILGVGHDDRYFGFYDNGSEQAGFVFDGTSESIGFTRLSIHADGAYSDPLSDALYLSVAGGLYQFDHDPNALIPFLWRSSASLFASPKTMTAAIVEAESYNDLEFSLYGDGELIYTRPVTEGRPFRIPSGYRARSFEIELRGTDVVIQAGVAGSITELKRG